jgi:hypothetical protein
MKRSQVRDGYFNFFFESPTIAKTWRAAHRLALGHRTFGRALRRSTIVVCQGSRVWDNYRLLHHSDSKKALDSLGGCLTSRRCSRRGARVQVGRSTRPRTPLAAERHDVRRLISSIEKGMVCQAHEFAATSILQPPAEAEMLELFTRVSF